MLQVNFHFFKCVERKKKISCEKKKKENVLKKWQRKQKLGIFADDIDIFKNTDEREFSY